MNRIFICSRFRGKNEIEFNKHVELAQKFSKFVSIKGYGAPFTPHLLYPQFLDDSVDKERDLGIDSGLVYLDVCDGLFAFVDDSETVSEGMRQEIQYAIDHGIKVVPFIYKNGRIKPKPKLLNEWSQTWLKVTRI